MVAENMKMVIKSKLLALKEENSYITYDFQNLDDNTYLMCTRLPNWDSPLINIDDIGYLQYKEVIGGESEWYHKDTATKYKYSYDNTFFINFVPYTEKQKLNNIDTYK